MKRLILITGIVLISCVLAQGFVPASENPPSNRAYEQTESVGGYVLRDVGGRLTVFRGSEKEPYMITDTYTSALPRADRLRLARGIEVESEAALRRTLEDYCS